jgi:hypothetical protein
MKSMSGRQGRDNRDRNYGRGYERRGNKDYRHGDRDYRRSDRDYSRRDRDYRHGDRDDYRYRHRERGQHWWDRGCGDDDCDQDDPPRWRPL